MESQISNELISSGMIGNDKLVCQYAIKHTTKGVWYGDNPFHHGTPIILIQIVLMWAAGRITYFLLRPCHQTLIISQILVSFHHYYSWFINLSYNY